MNTQERDLKEMVSEAVSSLIDIAASRIYRDKLLEAPEGGEVPRGSMTDDVMQMDSVTEQLNAEISGLKRNLEKYVSDKAELVTKIGEFREKLRTRHKKVPDVVLEKYEEFFNLDRTPPMAAVAPAQKTS